MVGGAIDDFRPARSAGPAHAMEQSTLFASDQGPAHSAGLPDIRRGRDGSLADHRLLYRAIQGRAVGAAIFLTIDIVMAKNFA